MTDTLLTIFEVAAVLGWAAALGALVYARLLADRLEAAETAGRWVTACYKEACGQLDGIVTALRKNGFSE